MLLALLSCGCVRDDSDRCHGDTPDPGCENAPNDGGGGEGGTATGDAGDGDGDGDGGAGPSDSSVPDPPVMCDDERDCTAEPRLLCGPEGTCVQCTDEAPCDGAQVCDETGSCVQCLDHEQCEDDVLRPVCRTDRKQCVACTGDEHCLVGARQRCSEDNECVECLNDGHCTAETADFCIANSCEQCRDDDDCSAAAGTPLCDDATKTCIAECTSHGDCTDPTKAQCDNGNCVACDADAQCEGVQRGGNGAEVCDDGECWECTGTKYAGCRDGGTDFVCDSLARVCSTREEESATVCDECISDAHCEPGMVCVHMQFGDPALDVGWFCQWEESATGDGAPNGACGAADPFVSTQPLLAEDPDVVSIDGEDTTICTLRVSTCPAFQHFSSEAIDCNTGSSGSPVLDDGLCGFDYSNDPAQDELDGNQDAYCAQFDSMTYRCTMHCLTDDDCRSGSACNTTTDRCNLQ